MSAESKKYRAEMRAKANRLGNSKSPGKLDASSWSPGSPLNADKKTGARPIRAKAYKYGGKIQGDRAPKNAGKAPRASGGKADWPKVPGERQPGESEAQKEARLTKRDKDMEGYAREQDRQEKTFYKKRADGGALSIHDTAGENKKKLGSFHKGGYDKGGRAEKCGGGSMKKGGRTEKADGGKTETYADTLKRHKGYRDREEAEGARTMQTLSDMKQNVPPKLKVSSKAKGGEVDDKAKDKKEIKVAIHKHDKQMHGGKFTKGLKKGGKPSADGGRKKLDDPSRIEAYDPDLDKDNRGYKAPAASAAPAPKRPENQKIQGADYWEGPKKAFEGMADYPPKAARSNENYVDYSPPMRKRITEEHFADAPAVAPAAEEDTRKRGGRAKRAKGGRAKGPTKINIIIGAPGGGQPPNMPPPQAPVRPPPPPQNASPPPMGGPPPGMPPGGPPPGPPSGPPPGMPPGGPPGGPMMRAAGGRTGYMSKDAGAGSGLGRLRKARKEGQEMPVRG